MIQENGAENSTPLSTVFRAAEVTPAPQPAETESVRVEKSQTDPATEVVPEFSIYEKVNRRPYVSEYFDLGDQYDSLSKDDKATLSEIEDIFRTTIKTKFLKDDRAVVKNLIAGIEKKLGLNNLNDPYYRLDKISKYLRVMGTDI